MEIQLHNSANENPKASKTIFAEINFLVRKNNSGKTFDRDQKISSGEKNDKKWSQAVTQTQIDFLMEEHNFRLTLLAATTTAKTATTTAATTATTEPTTATPATSRFQAGHFKLTRMTKPLHWWHFLQLCQVARKIIMVQFCSTTKLKFQQLFFSDVRSLTIGRQTFSLNMKLT